MKKNTKDFDRIINQGYYDNLDLSIVKSNSKTLTIAVSPFPLSMVIALNIVFVCFFGGFSYFLFTKNVELNKIFLVLAIYLMTAFVFTFIVWYRHQKEEERGDWLIYNKENQTVKLPRENIEVQVDEIDHIQYISTHLNEGNASELNIVINKSGTKVRYPILRHVCGANVFQKTRKALINETDFLIYRIEESIFGGTITKKIISKNHKRNS